MRSLFNHNNPFRKNFMAVITIIKEKTSIILLFSIFLFSFILDIYILTRYNLSYGMDGPFYDLKVLSILQTGFPASNDPPLVYYMLTPFVALTGNSFLGIKIGMSIIGSMMVFPAYLLTETFSNELDFKSKVPALLSAFLIAINLSYFQMIGDFMQNLAGVFFLLLLIYFNVKWLENTKQWHKYGLITLILLLCSILTHIYTGMLAVVIFISLLIFNITIIKYKTGKLPIFDLKVFGIMGLLIIGVLFAMFNIYPIMLSKFTTVISFFNGTTSSNTSIENSTNLTLFLTIPFLLGIYATIKTLFRGIKDRNTIQNIVTNKKTLLSWVYLVMTVVLIVLSIVPSDYQSRFVAMVFVPIALITPIGLKLIENWLSNKFPGKNIFKIGLISIIAIIFAMSSFYTAAGAFSGLSPSISSDEYNNLLHIKTSYTSNKIDPNGIIMVDDYHTGYWVQYVLGMQVETGNLTELKAKYPDRKIYRISLNQSQISLPKTGSQELWYPFLPYSFPFGGVDLLSNLRSSGLPVGNITNLNHSPPGFGNKNLSFNDSNGPINHQNRTNPINTSNQVPLDSGNRFNGGIDSINTLNTFNTGTIIFNGGSIKIYELS